MKSFHHTAVNKVCKPNFANAEMYTQLQCLVMGRTAFFRTSIKLEHHFSNIERTRMCSSIGDRT